MKSRSDNRSRKQRRSEWRYCISRMGPALSAGSRTAGEATVYIIDIRSLFVGTEHEAHP